MQTKQILNVTIDNITFIEALDVIDSFIKAKKPHQVVTVNPEFIMAAQSNGEFRQVLNSADLRVPDGVGLVWLGGFRQRVSGADLVTVLAKKGHRIFLLGGEVGVAEKAGQNLAKLGAEIVGTESGGVVNDLKNFPRDVLDSIEKAKPAILLVGFGAPKQDLFIAEYKDYLGVPVAIGVGGTFDYLSGRVKRAPKFIQAIGLEWLWRLIGEPKRFNRIITATIRFPVAYLVSKVKS